MPELSISKAQKAELEAIREELEAAYVGEYGTLRTEDAIQYLLDTYTPPAESGGDRSAADIEGLTAINGVGEATAKSLAIAGFRSVGDVAAADPEALTEIKGIGDEQAVDIVVAATEAGEAGEAGTGKAERREPDSEGTDDTELSDDPEEPDNPDDREESPEDTLKQAMSLLDAHDGRWRESDGEEPYEVDLPDGATEAVRTKDDIRRLLFKHWK